MKLKLRSIMNAKKILMDFSERKDFDGSTTLKITRNIQKLNPEFINFEKINVELITKLGEKKEIIKENPEDEKEYIVKVLPQNEDKYNKQINEMLDQEYDIDIILLDSSKVFGYSPIQLISVEWMFE